MSLKKLIEKRDDYAQYMIDEITTIIKTFGKRNPGSEGEKKAVEYMGTLIDKACDGNVKIEPFKLHPMGFFHWIWITGACVVAALVLSFFYPLLGVILTIFGFTVLTTQFVFYLRTFDKLFKPATSHNLIALRKPTGEVKRRIFFNGHPDAAFEWTMNNWFGGVGFVSHAILSGVGAVYVAIVSLAAAIINKAAYVPFTEWAFGLQIATYVGLLFIPCYIILFFMFNTNYCVDGANDNLTACMLAVAVVKALDDENIQLENTEVGVLLSGSEEGGLRGAKAFCEMHPDEYHDVETIILAFDTMHELDYLYVNERDMNAIVKADDYSSGLFFKACDNLGIKCFSGSVPMGATDSAAFNLGGYRAAGITALNHNLQDYYHTRRDSYDNLDKECLSACFAACIESLRIFDAQEKVLTYEERKARSKENMKQLKAERKVAKTKK